MYVDRWKTNFENKIIFVQKDFSYKFDFKNVSDNEFEENNEKSAASEIGFNIKSISKQFGPKCTMRHCGS